MSYPLCDTPLTMKNNTENNQTKNQNRNSNKTDRRRPCSLSRHDPDRDNPAAAALDLVSDRILDALASFDWDKWFRRHSDPTSKNLEKFVRILVPLSRAVVEHRKYLARLDAAEAEKAEAKRHELAKIENDPLFRDM